MISRRDFLQQAVKLLPMLGITVIIPTIVSATPISANDCKDSCKNGCHSHCANTCRVMCHKDGCTATCAASCYGSCMRACADSCRNTEKITPDSFTLKPDTLIIK